MFSETEKLESNKDRIIDLVLFKTYNIDSSAATRRKGK